ncbi:MAG TPA: LysR substrate-binding domain-containing protein [Rhizomicrobium sp.]|nr:LysR substrate-binding domain-containing protein [Rhizomicrobium sp.]
MTSKRLPPISTLQAFDLAARLGSFTRVAQRLGLSQSAVTRQVALLEEDIGVKLFERGRRGVTLTPEGQLYRDEIAPAFEQLEAAASRMRDHGAEDLLRLRVYTTFAMQWLIPRLHAFKLWAPTIRVSINTDVAPIDFDRAAIDAAIQFGPGDRAGAVEEVLIADEIEPVCSPKLFTGPEGTADLDALLRLPVLHARYRRNDWLDWVIAQGTTEMLPAAQLELPSSILAYKAAECGLGIAMGQIPLLQAEFAQGLLVRPFQRPLRRSMAYYLLTSSRRDPPLRVRTFRAWLRHELKSDSGRQKTK